MPSRSDIPPPPRGVRAESGELRRRPRSPVQKLVEQSIELIQGVEVDLEVTASLLLGVLDELDLGPEPALQSRLDVAHVCRARSLCLRLGRGADARFGALADQR